MSVNFITAPIVGIVIIGRNEGRRLKSCLNSVIEGQYPIVYVDSGSIDDSVELAKSTGIAVIELDPKIPFTAARARNEGFHFLRKLNSNIEYIQFVDGDCELRKGWIEKAIDFFELHQDVAVVCGRLREKNPDLSIYSLLCDIEWNVPEGETRSCGGIAMMRTVAFDEIQGFRIDLIAGEEPELCIRLHSAGWRLWRISVEMATHDSDMKHFKQWWKRAVRSGYAFAQLAFLHGAPPQRHYVKESRRALFWGLFLPVFILIIAKTINPMLLGLFTLYVLQIFRLRMQTPPEQAGPWQRATFLVLGRFPECIGQIRFIFNRVFGGNATLIEHK